METSRVHWKLFNGTLEEWIAQQKEAHEIITRHTVINGADISLGRIAVDKSGNKVAEEVNHLTGPYCIILV